LLGVEQSQAPAINHHLHHSLRISTLSLGTHWYNPWFCAVFCEYDNAYRHSVSFRARWLAVHKLPVGIKRPPKSYFRS
jgi:hypothetical protein